MERRLLQLFDYQRFAGNPVLQSMIDRTENRYGIVSLADEDLANLSAAGDSAVSGGFKKPEDNRK